MAIGSGMQPGSLIWAKGLLGRDGDVVLWAALVEQQVVRPPEYIVSASRLASMLGRLSGEEAWTADAKGHLVWTLPDGVACVGVAPDGYAATAKTLLSKAQRSVMMVSPYLEARGVGLLTKELLDALHRGVNATVLTHGASDAASLASAALEEIRRAAAGLTGSLTVYSAAAETVLLHPKLLVVDSRLALLGSANITGRGLSMNFEAGVSLGHAAAAEIERVVGDVIGSDLVVMSFSTRPE